MFAVFMLILSIVSLYAFTPTVLHLLTNTVYLHLFSNVTLELVFYFYLGTKLLKILLTFGKAKTPLKSTVLLRMNPGLLG